MKKLSFPFAKLPEPQSESPLVGILAPGSPPEFLRFPSRLEQTLLLDLREGPSNPYLSSASLDSFLEGLTLPLPLPLRIPSNGGEMLRYQKILLVAALLRGV